jgi:demethylmenaquinone methyltransferase/2-methoxy-6-polyprenyl-1,4-benzoquinol methylase
VKSRLLAGDGEAAPVDDVDALLAEQASYYRAHAEDYDAAYAGRGFWDELVDLLPIRGDVLELACGTGRWTPLLAARARSVTAVDVSPEMIRIARQRVGDRPVEFVQADVLTWSPPRSYDTVFFGFWLSHVPPQRFEAFWRMVRRSLGRGGSACFLDSNPEERDLETELSGDVPTVLRKARDGREFRVVKVFYTAEELTARIASVGWHVTVENVYERFLVGVATPEGPGADAD